MHSTSIQYDRQNSNNKQLHDEAQHHQHKIGLDLSPNSVIGNATRYTKRQSHARLVFLDLDNTLIPTQWIMEQWRRSSEHPNRASLSINKRLEDAGLFTALDRFFDSISRSARGPQQIVIVTNAAVKTVEAFYLNYCVPQLNTLLHKYQIPIRSTEVWLDKCGGVPPVEQEAEFREYYTNVKLLQFDEELKSFAESLRDLRYQQRSVKAGGGPNTNKERICFDVISVGDQLCEITAAVRLSLSNASMVRHTKLLMILDFMSDRFASTTPEGFVGRLHETLSTLMELTASKTPTVITRPLVSSISPPLTENSGIGCLSSNPISVCNDYERSESKCLRQRFKKRRGLNDSTISATKGNRSRNIAVWVPKNTFAYCIGRPKHFWGSDDCPYFGIEEKDCSPCVSDESPPNRVEVLVHATTTPDVDFDDDSAIIVKQSYVSKIDKMGMNQKQSNKLCEAEDDVEILEGESWCEGVSINQTTCITSIRRCP